MIDAKSNNDSDDSYVDGNGGDGDNGNDDLVLVKMKMKLENKGDGSRGRNKAGIWQCKGHAMLSPPNKEE